MPQIAEVAETLEAQVRAGRTVGCVGLLGNVDGVLHASAHGRVSADGEAPMRLDSVFRIYSMTKAIGTVAALRLVEQGRLSLDTPVAEVLPEFGRLRRFKGWEDGAPVFSDLSKPCLVRHLITHTSGLVYDFWNADQLKLSQHFGVNRATGERANLRAFHHFFEPGEQWAYSVSIDWLGLVVEAVTGEPIRATLQRDILGPLAMADTDTRFTEAMEARKVAAHQPAADGGFETFEADGATPDFDSMGGGMKGTGPDYMRFLRMIARGGELDGARILKPETVKGMFENAIGDVRLERIGAAMPARTASLDFFPGVEKTFTLGFMRVEEDIPGRRRKGAVSWAGIMNTHYWIDPAAGLIGVLMMQQSPFMSDEAMAVYEAFETAAYARAATPA